MSPRYPHREGYVKITNDGHIEYHNTYSEQPIDELAKRIRAAILNAIERDYGSEYTVILKFIEEITETPQVDKVLRTFAIAKEWYALVLKTNGRFAITAAQINNQPISVVEKNKALLFPLRHPTTAYLAFTCYVNDPIRSKLTLTNTVINPACCCEGDVNDRRCCTRHNQD